MEPNVFRKHLLNLKGKGYPRSPKTILLRRNLFLKGVNINGFFSKIRIGIGNRYWVLIFPSRQLSLETARLLSLFQTTSHSADVQCGYHCHYQLISLTDVCQFEITPDIMLTIATVNRRHF